MSDFSCSSFDPIADPDAQVLILGSMPGAESLRQQQYYAHPRNLFWVIMGDLFGAGPELPYRHRVERLRARRIALWDVLASCERPGSLDSSIDMDRARPNDMVSLLEDCPGIHHVFFNGAMSEKLYMKLVHQGLLAQGFLLKTIRLPSTSPAHAGVSRQRKLADWSQVKEALV